MPQFANYYKMYTYNKKNLSFICIFDISTPELWETQKYFHRNHSNGSLPLLIRRAGWGKKIRGKGFGETSPSFIKTKLLMIKIFERFIYLSLAPVCKVVPSAPPTWGEEGGVNFAPSTGGEPMRVSSKSKDGPPIGKWGSEPTRTSHTKGMNTWKKILTNMSK